MVPGYELGIISFSGELEAKLWHPFFFHFALSVSPLENEGDGRVAKGPPAGFTTPSKGPWLTTLRVHRRARYTLGALQLIIPRDFAPI